MYPIQNKMEKHKSIIKLINKADFLISMDLIKINKLIHI